MANLRHIKIIQDKIYIVKTIAVSNSGRPRPWTEKEKTFLRENYATMTDVEIARKLGRGALQVRRKRQRLDMYRDRRPQWTETDRKFLRKNVAVMTDEQIAENLGKPRSGVRHMRQRMNLGSAKRPARRNRWTGEDDGFISAHPDMNPEEVARRLGRSVASIHHRRGKLGLREQNQWRQAELRFLREHPDMRSKELAKHVNRSVTTIRQKRLEIGLDRYVERVEWTGKEVRIAKEMLQSPMRDLLKALPRHNKGTIRNTLTKLGRKRTIRSAYGNKALILAIPAPSDSTHGT